MPPPKAKLHKTTGKLKKINKSYVSPASATNNNSSSNRTATSSTSTTTTTTTTTTSSSSSAQRDGPAVIVPASSTGQMDVDVEQQFELELCWCVQSMEKSIESGHLTAKQAADTEKTIRLLKSTTQPIIKKRQIMRTAFGDYRAKMADEEKRLRLGTRQIQFTQPPAKATIKSHFVKKSIAATLGEKNFQFNFPIEEIEKLNLEENCTNAANNGEQNANNGNAEKAPMDNTDAGASESSTNTEPSGQNDATTSAPFQFTKFAPSDNSFKFNFSVARFKN